MYAHLQEDVDTANSRYQGMSSRAMSLYTQAAAALSYFNSEMMAADEESILTFIKENNDLALYAHELDELFKARPHILSEKEEAILARGSEVMAQSSKTFSILNNADLEFPTIKDEDNKDIKLSHGLYGKLMESNNRRVREYAFKAVYKTYTGFRKTFATT